MTKNGKCHPLNYTFLIILINTNFRNNMNTEQILWNKAEEDFHKWIKNPAEYEDN